MRKEELLQEFHTWLTEHEIEDVEIEDGVGPEEKFAAITFPIDEEGELPYDIIATLSDGGQCYFCIEYCDIPEVDEGELYRFVNELNQLTFLTVTVEDGCLCFSYALSQDYLAGGELLVKAFFDIWDAVDVLSEEVCDAFGLFPAEAEEEAAEDEASEEEDTQ